MILPLEILLKIYSYLPNEKCYRCNKLIYPLDKNFKIIHNNNVYKLCSIDCCEYQHY